MTERQIHPNTSQIQNLDAKYVKVDVNHPPGAGVVGCPERDREAEGKKDTDRFTVQAH